MRRPRPRYFILMLSVVLMVSGAAIGHFTQNGFGTVITTEVDFEALDGSNIHSTLQKPVSATSSQPLPAVVVIHGTLQNKEWLMAFGIELARRGFVVLTIDANGHGNSDSGTGSGIAAVEFVEELDFVDSSAIGLIGHSMGGGLSWSAIRESNIAVKSLVLVGSWIPGNLSSVPYIPNLLVVVGEFDSISSYPSNLTLLESAFEVTDIKPGVTYGDFDNGTARRVVISRTNHLFETVDPILVSESVEWMKDSLKSGNQDSYWSPSTELVYPIWLLGGFIAILGAVLSIFPFLAILIDLPFFLDLKHRASSQHFARTSSYLRLGLVYGVIGLAGFFPLLAIGSLFDSIAHFPHNYGLAVCSWILGSALIALLVLHLICQSRSTTGSNLKEPTSITKSKRNRISFLKSTILVLIVILWLYSWTLVVDLGLALDFRCFLPGFNDLTLSRAILLLVYIPIFLFYFHVEGLWITQILRTKPKEDWVKTQISLSARGIFIKCIPYLIVIGIEYGTGLLTGITVVPGMIGFSFLFFYAFLPWFAVTTVIIIWSDHLTGGHFLGVLLNAIMCAWLLATILSFPSWV